MTAVALTIVFVLVVLTALVGAAVAWYALEEGGPAEFVLGAIIAVPTAVVALVLYPLTALPGLL
ncbi:hypothetical protein [Streptomyces sp. GZWMJZ-114]|uniref:hypothetical protein n=1 Tax=Streptomyces sp. GZWMJZ-114 TaxID=2494734 RepID=UPI0010125709|nr:hypothetical protein [Streptomyces sp. GZWMJZ-114]